MFVDIDSDELNKIYLHYIIIFSLVSVKDKTLLQ